MTHDHCEGTLTLIPVLLCNELYASFAMRKMCMANCMVCSLNNSFDFFQDVNCSKCSCPVLNEHFLCYSLLVVAKLARANIANELSKGYISQTSQTQQWHIVFCCRRATYAHGALPPCRQHLQKDHPVTHAFAPAAGSKLLEQDCSTLGLLSDSCNFFYLRLGSCLQYLLQDGP